MLRITYEIGPFRLDTAAKAVTHAGAPVALGARAVGVLALLVDSAEEYVSKTRLMDEAWPGAVVEESNLAVQISAIRRELARAPGGENWIETLARRGYRFVGPVTKLPDSTARDAGSTNSRSNLPEPLTSFVGRDREVAEIQELLAGNRLLTLTGAGGVGKTRLALRVASTVLHEYRDGVWLVELAALSDPGLVPQTAATALGLKELPGTSPTQTLVEYLKAKRLLLVLDNAEHLLAACAQLTDTVLRQCPQVRVLATSRERLGVPGELTYRVPSLSMPDPRRDVTAQSVVDYESVRLFRERAQLHLPQFAVTDLNAPALANICRRLDGIALAIELAAARVRSMSVEELNQRLDQRLGLLTGGSRTVLHRQQTLRAAIDWSYDSLSGVERALFYRLAVFAGGWTVEAAERVCAGKGIEAREVLDLLTSLVDKNLVVPEERSAATRYRLLETVHHYATERLQSAGEKAAVRERHFGWFLQLAERVEASILGGPQQKQALDLLEADHDNLRAALAWSLEAPERCNLALRLCGTLYRFWSRRGYWQEGYAGCVKALAQSSRSGDKTARAKVLLTAGSIGNNVPGAETRILLEHALALSREAGDRNTEAMTLNNLARVLDWDVELSRGRSLLEQARRINRELGNKTLELHNMSNLVNVLRQQHDPAAALALAEEGLATSRTSGDRWLETIFLYLLGRVALDRIDVAVAQRFYEQALAIARELVMPDWQSFSLVKLAFLAVVRSDPASARCRLAEAVELSRRFGGRLNLSECFNAMGVLASDTGQHDQAARLWGMAEALLGALRSSDVLDRDLIDPYHAKSREALGDAAYDAARADGRALPREKVIDQAVAWLVGAS